VYCYAEGNQQEIYNKKTFTKYADSVVYLYVEKTATGERQKGVYFPIVDEFSQLNIVGSGLAFRNSTEVALYADIHGFITAYRFYKHVKTPGHFVGSFTLTITLVDGKIESTYWDDTCSECSLDRCIDEKNCGLTYEEAGCADQYNCNIMVYLAWVGTDENGVPCRSYSYAPSRFARFSLVPVYKSAANITQEQFFSTAATNEDVSLYSIFNSTVSTLKKTLFG
jgi:hypothetical protein